MTLEEKANITVGYTPENGCSGATGSVPRLNWPGLCLADAGQGVRGTDLINAYPASFHVGASWNRALTFSRAAHMAREFKAKGFHVLLGPVVSPLGRITLGGRNWEGFSNDRKFPLVSRKRELKLIIIQLISVACLLQTLYEVFRTKVLLRRSNILSAMNKNTTVILSLREMPPQYRR